MGHQKRRRSCQRLNYRLCKRNIFEISCLELFGRACSFSPRSKVEDPVQRPVVIRSVDRCRSEKGVRLHSSFKVSFGEKRHDAGGDDEMGPAKKNKKSSKKL